MSTPWLLDAQAGEPVGEGLVASEAEQLGGAGLVVAGLGEGALEVVAREVVEEVLQAEAVAEGVGQEGRVAGLRGGEQGLADGVDADRLAVGPEGGA